MKSFSKLITEAVKKNVADKDKIRHYQAKQHLAGNKITWDEAKKFIEGGMKAIEKEKKKNMAAAKRAANKGKPRKPGDPNKKKGLTDAQFKKMMRAAGNDFKADASYNGGEYDLGEVAWDIAGSLMWDPIVDAYVRKKLAGFTREDPEDIEKEKVQEYIADNIV